MANLIYNWQAPATGIADSYNLYVGNAAGAEAFLASVAGTVFTYTQAAVAVGSYYAVVKAVKGGLETTASNESFAVVSNPPPATVPALIRQGATATFTMNGADLPAAQLPWDILYHGVVIATSTQPGTGVDQWLVFYNNGNISVSVPLHATIDSGYEVRLDLSKL